MKLLLRITKKISLLAFSLYAKAASAQPKFFNTPLEKEIKESAKQLAEEGAGYAGNITVGGIIAVLIQVVLAILGIVFVALMVYAGIIWLFARGNEEQVNKAKDIIKHAFWGLVITLAAWSISYFVVRILALGVIGGGGTGVEPGSPGFQ